MTTPHSVLQEEILPARLKALWAEAGAGHMTNDEAYARQLEEVARYKAVWADALLLPGETDLEHSLLLELSRLVDCDDLAEVERRCRGAMLQMKDDWNRETRAGDPDSVVKYYDQSTHYAYELMWWHTLSEDESPLAHVAALHLAVKNGCRTSLDFGAGVGSASLLFERHGIDITLSDISSTLLDFARRRLEARGVKADYIDLKTTALPENAYDFISAMDVFEHIAEPEIAVEPLAAAIRPGGILFGRFSAEIDPDRPSHIAKDFDPMFRRLAELGFSECWKDDWLWGHQAFQKARA